MGSELKQYSLLEVAEHNSKDDLWLVIDNKVYDVTKFLLDHPGGEDILLEGASPVHRDMHREFEDVGHSDAARHQLDEMLARVKESTESVMPSAP